MQSEPRGSHRMFPHLEERDVVRRGDGGLPREESSEKCVCAGVVLEEDGTWVYHTLKETKETGG